MNLINNKYTKNTVFYIRKYCYQTHKRFILTHHIIYTLYRIRLEKISTV